MLKLVLAVVLVASACASEVVKEEPPTLLPKDQIVAPRYAIHCDPDTLLCSWGTDAYADIGEPVDATVYALVVETWNAHGLPDASGCAAPREVIADWVLAEEICYARGIRGCYINGLIVIVDRWSTDTDRTRVHEILHWLAECSGAATHEQNRDHALLGVWRGPDSVLTAVYEGLDQPS